VANEEHIKILKQGVEVWNKWRKDNPDITPDLTSTALNNLNLEGANLIKADFDRTSIIHSNFNNAIFTEANMHLASFIVAQFVKADLSNSGITTADFIEANLEKATLANARIIGARFRNVIFKDTDFSNAHMHEVSFSNVDLSSAKGLESVTHEHPSTIGIDTLYKSGGNLPPSFLRGCGIPDDFITFIPSHFGIQQAIQFYSCFISYSTKDEEFARRLYSRMRDEKLRVWFAPEDMKGGEKLHEQIERAIQLHDRLLIILSEESMASEWVMTEIRRARKTEIEQKRRKLFPILLVDFEAVKKWKCFDGDSGKDLAVELREYFMPDFSNWKDHDSFEKGFERLLRDLRAEEEKQAQKRVVS
jgi:hypothetical protein